MIVFVGSPRADAAADDSSGELERANPRSQGQNARRRPQLGPPFNHRIDCTLSHARSTETSLRIRAGSAGRRRSPGHTMPPAPFVLARLHRPVGRDCYMWCEMRERLRLPAARVPISRSGWRFGACGSLSIVGAAPPTSSSPLVVARGTAAGSPPPWRRGRRSVRCSRAAASMLRPVTMDTTRCALTALDARSACPSHQHL